VFGVAVRGGADFLAFLTPRAKDILNALFPVDRDGSTAIRRELNGLFSLEFCLFAGYWCFIRLFISFFE
jgi:hypothetical protein